MRVLFAISIVFVWAMLSIKPVWSQIQTSTTCSQSGSFVTDNNSGCKVFFQCWGGYLYQYTCPWGTIFNPNRNYCDWPENYVCPTPPTTTTTTTKTTTAKAGATTTTTAPAYTGPYAQQYNQCGGYYYTGPTVCAPGCYCRYNSDWWSECVIDPNAPTTTVATTTSTSTTTTTTKTTTTTTTKTSTTTTTKSNGSTSKTTTGTGTTTTTTTTTTKTSTTTTNSGQYLITYDEFKNALTSNGCPIPSQEKYLAMVSQAGPSGHIFDKQHLAMFLAQIMWESDCLLATNEYACANGCPNNYPVTGPGIPGYDYHGRGYIQLTWDYNYAACSRDLYGDDRLIKNPDQVATDQNVAWATAFWYWSRVVAPRQGVINYQFGDSTMAINGALECGGYNTRARARYDRYVNTLKAFGITATPIESGCYN